MVMGSASEQGYDSDYANHPPPTDSEAEIEVIQEQLPSYYSAGPLTSSSASLSTVFGGPGGDLTTRPSNISLSSHHLHRNGSSSRSSSTNYTVTNSGTLIHNHSSSDFLTLRSTGISLSRDISGNGGSLATINSNSNANTHVRTESTETRLETDEDYIMDQSFLFGISSTANTSINLQRNSLKELGLKRMTPRQHTAVAICRDFSLIVILKNLYVLWRSWFNMVNQEEYYANFTSVRASEFFLAGIWCCVSGYLSYSILDGLMVRWIVMYAISAAVVRMLSISLFIILLVEFLNFVFNTEDNNYCLPTWIIISCVMTLIYIIQNFVTSNLRLDEHLLEKQLNTTHTDTNSNDNNNNTITDFQDGNNSNDQNNNDTITENIENIEVFQITDDSESALKSKDTKIEQQKVPRTVDLYNITVFAVVPIGIASFVTMVGLLRLIIIFRMDIGMELGIYNKSST